VAADVCQYKSFKINHLERVLVAIRFLGAQEALCNDRRKDKIPFAR